ncbi:hypothetical protein Celaphus_00009681 [Cervus elaphus hippelaphus]|uniref:Uncharacterized protein n=1 Tax=Cervus elaphus hippelaphus TaxID=46360 RepID=A0A212C190_CEREH|nr:hypothetical protein Celaphus_00009681 [Cervus elaphus hippelaphus]
MTDFVITIVATFLWLVSTSAWVKALKVTKIATSHYIVQEFKPCNLQKWLSCMFGPRAASPGKACLLAGRKGVSSEELLYSVIYIEAVEAGLK